MLKQIKDLLDSLAYHPLPRISESPPEMSRAAFSAMISFLEKPAPKLERMEDKIINGPNGPIPIRLYDPKPKGQNPTPIIIFFHGGGFVMGNIDDYGPLTASIAVRNTALVIYWSSVTWRFFCKLP